MTDVFVSYSRQDQNFVRRLYDALEGAGRGAWVDWEGIPLTADWLAEIHAAIESADTFVFVISPDSVTSQVCMQEIEYAVKSNKRLVPIVFRDADPSIIHPAIAAINWIFIRDTDDFDAAFQSLIEALDTDLEWVKAHTRLLMRAVEWGSGQQDSSLLLRGSDLEEAEQWLAKGASRTPGPTELQTEYIIASRQEATRQQRRTLIAVAGVLALTLVLCVVAVIAAIIANNQTGIARKESDNRATQESIALTQRSVAEQEANSRATQQAIAEEQARISLARQLAAQSGSLIHVQPDLGLLLAIASNRVVSTTEGRAALLQGMVVNPYLIQYLDHSDTPADVAISPDGRVLAACASTSVLWDLTASPITATALRSATNTDTSYCSTPAFSADGNVLAMNLSTEVALWDTASEEWIGEPLEAPGNRSIYVIAISPNGSLVAAASLFDSSVLVWNTASGRAVPYSFGQYPDGVNALAFSPDGTILAVSSFYDISLRDTATGRQIGQPLTNPHSVTSTVFNADGSLLAAGNLDNTVILWQVATGQPLGSPLEGHRGAVYSVAFSPDGSVLASGGGDNTIRLWDVLTQQPIGDPLIGHLDQVSSVMFHPDGEMLASGGWDGSIILWDLLGRQSLIAPLPEDVTQPETGILGVGMDQVAIPGTTLIAAPTTRQGRFLLWDVQTREAIQELRDRDNDFRIYATAASPDGRWLVTGHELSGISVWDMETLETRYGPLEGHTKYITALAVSPASTMFASGDGDGNIFLWNLEDGSVVHGPLTGHDGIIFDLKFSPDGKTLLSMDKEGLFLVWDVATGQRIGIPYRNLRSGDLPETVSAAGFVDGQWVVVARDDFENVDVTEVTGGEQIGSWKVISDDSSLESITLSPDGAVVATGTDRGRVTLWDASTGNQLGGPLVDQQDFRIDVIALSPDGSLVAAAGCRANIDCYEGRVVLWDRTSGQILGEPFTGHEKDVIDVKFSADSRYLLSASLDTAYVWEINFEDWIARACHIANRPISQEEWTRYVGDLPFEAICP